MKKREFGTVLRTLTSVRRGTRHLDLGKVAAAPVAVRAPLVRFIVRHRGPVLVDLLAGLSSAEMVHLEALGYLYTTTGPETGLRFRHTCESVIR